MSRIPAAVLAVVSLVALGFAVIRASCATAVPPARGIAADAAMQSHGILGFDVIADAPRALDVRLDLRPEGGATGRTGWLRVRAGADGIEQTLTGPDGPFIVRSERDVLTLGRAGAERAVAHRVLGAAPSGDRGDARGAWSGDALDAADAESVARVLALDVALAVQGSSLVFDRSVYASCTQRCLRAEACVQHGRHVATCADDIVACAACLARAP